MGGLGEVCCQDPCCTAIELPDETWETFSTCCIKKTIEDSGDSWHYLCSEIIRECTQTQSVDLRVWRHLYPVVPYTYGCDGPDPIACVSPRPGAPPDCYIQGVLIPHCDDDEEECGLFTLYATVNTKQRLVLKYKHLRDVITITKLTIRCDPDETPSCKYLVVYQKVFEGFWGQVAFGSSTRTVSSLSGCCKVTGSSTVVTELTCEQAADALTTGGTFSISRSAVYDEIPESLDFEHGQNVVCDPLPPDLCIYPGSDGPIICSIDVPIFVYPDAVCTCSDEDVHCYVITVGTSTCPPGGFGCIILEPYPSERFTKHICGAYTPGSTTLLPGYALTYDGTYCYIDCGQSIAVGTGSGTLTCPPYPATACRAVDGFISRVECESLTSTTYCSPYTARCIVIEMGNWIADIL